MKKIWSLILCLVLVCTALVGCADDPIGGYIENYPEITEKVERLDLNLYIVTGDATSENAKTSVATRIAGHTKADYNTVLNVKYVTAANYEKTVADAIAAGGKDIPHIVLITSEAMFSSLYNAEGGNKLADLTAYYNPISNREFARLNTQISSSLLEASKIDEKYFTVPNNRVIGEYTYVVINTAVRDDFHYGNQEILAVNTLEAVENLKNDLATKVSADLLPFLIRVETGSYEKRDQLAKEGFCNVISTPVVTKADAFASAFAIVNTTQKYNDRAMKMIYAINNDAELRNILQYGVLGANYEVVNGDIVRVNDEKNTYQMNIEYTGDVFKASYSSEFGWVASVYNHRLQHSKEQRFFKAN